MPIYEFECQSCHTKFDHLARTMAGSPAVNCPQCASAETRRALSVFAVAAEGGGTSTAAEEGPRCGCGKMPGSCGG